ncbi:hypothetical protein LTS18_003194 [Coniosporium uncinatum]|uniref:Uncharacterized protein n=1 Tax=Coniosporium uncinatum TaxID=93489 RepID=A0ACC3D7B8_9PEZI|nr:hypothetical protein LTS18_003194 [Coniosporium uncinatum]
MELRRARRTGGTGDDANKTGISLSGLLNAIDGVASHEGRVLVMTTNHPEKLDKALIRPGRVDMQIEFKNASRQQARDIFLRMYSDDVTEQLALDAVTEDDTVGRQTFSLSGLLKVFGSEKATLPKPSTATTRKSVITSALSRGDDTTITAKTPLLTPPQTPGLPPTTTPPPDSQPPVQITKTSTTPDFPPSQDELRTMAETFADLIPERVFSPAELQSFLIMRKKSPRRALEDVEGWREELREAKGVDGEKGESGC